MPGQIRAYMISEVVGTDPWTTLEEKAQAEQVSSSRHCPLILLPLRPQGHRRVVLDGSPEQSGCASAHPPPREALALLALAHYWSTLSKCCTVRKAGRPLVPHVGWHDGWPVETAGRLMARWLDITSQSAFLLSLLIRVLPFCHTFPLRSNNSQLNSHKLNSQPCCLGLSEGAHGCLPRRPPAPDAPRRRDRVWTC